MRSHGSFQVCRDPMGVLHGTRAQPEAADPNGGGALARHVPWKAWASTHGTVLCAACAERARACAGGLAVQIELGNEIERLQSR